MRKHRNESLVLRAKKGELKLESRRNDVVHEYLQRKSIGSLPLRLFIFQEMLL